MRTPLVALAICVALVLLFQQVGVDLDDALGDNGRSKLYIAVLASLAGMELGSGLAIYLWRRHALESSVRAKLAARPSINPADPTLAERLVVAIHAMGFRVSSDCIAHACAWSVLQRFDETADHMFLMLEPKVGFIVPKRELAPETILALRRTMQAFQEAKASARSPVPAV